MKKTIIAAALLAATTIPVEALAVSSANGNGTCGNGQTTCGSTPTTPTTPTTPAVTSPSVNVGPVASTSSSGAAALSNSDSAALAFNAVDNTNRNVNRNANNLENTNNVGPLTNTLDNAVNVSASNQNTAFGGDGGSAYVGPVSSTNENNATGGTASATTGPVTSNTASNSNQSQSTSNANNSSVNVEGDQYRAAASTAYAPQLVAGSDTCMGSSSAGGQGIGFGFSLGTSWTDKNCVRLKQTRQLQSMGEGAAARELMCQDVDVWMAFAAAGTPCLSPKPARRRK
jgi:hypothetical protein